MSGTREVRVVLKVTGVTPNYTDEQVGQYLLHILGREFEFDVIATIWSDGRDLPWQGGELRGQVQS